MTDTRDSNLVHVEGGASPRSLFPGYYSLTEDQRRAAFQRGLVSLDANALLDLYRFTPTGRVDFLDLLSSMKSRLFLTHQATREFYRNRLDVVRDRILSTTKDIDEISTGLLQIGGKVSGFSRRYQVEKARRDALISEIDRLSSEARESLSSASVYDIDLSDVRAGRDMVLDQFDRLFADRVGPPLAPPEHKAALIEAERRIAGRIPPGYMDAKKGDEDERRAGDYLLWRQLIREAKKHELPVLLISNDEKEDWVVDFHGQIVGPRPELVLEFQQETGTYFYKVTVSGFLATAPNYLGRDVSEGSIAEAQELDSSIKVEVRFSEPASEALPRLSQGERTRFFTALDEVIDVLKRGQRPHLSTKQINRDDRDDIVLYLLPFAKAGQALLTIEDASDVNRGASALVNVVMVKSTRLLKPPTDHLDAAEDAPLEVEIDIREDL